MKSIIATITIIGFLIIAVFGVFVMNHESGHSHEGCIAAAAQGSHCPKEKNALSFLNFHFSAFQSFSTAIFGDNFTSALLLLIALGLTAAVGIIGIIHPTIPALSENYYYRQFLKSYSFLFQQNLAHWLALHENSPTRS